MTLCLVEEIPAFANERGSGVFPESCCGIFGDQMCVETDENDTKSWNDRPSGDIIESTDRLGGRNTIYLGNVGLMVLTHNIMILQRRLHGFLQSKSASIPRGAARGL